MICSVATRSSAVVRDELVHPTSRRMYERILVVISHKYIDPSLKREYELSDRKTCECIAWPVHGHGICMDRHGHGTWTWPVACGQPVCGTRSRSIDRGCGSYKPEGQLKGQWGPDMLAEMPLGQSRGDRCLPHIHMAEARAAASVRGRSARTGGSAA